MDHEGRQPSDPVLDMHGQVHETTFRILNNFRYRNFYLPTFVGRLVETQQGTLVEGEFCDDVGGMKFMGLWLGSTAMGGLALAPLIAPEGQRRLKLLCSAIGLAGLCVLKLGQMVAYGEKCDILDFIKTTLDAHELEASTPL